MSGKRKIRKPVIKRKGKWFNTITGRFVSESTAKRYNSFYIRNPDAPHVRAYGNYKYKKKKKYTEQTKKLKKLIYKDTQIIRTKDRHGKTIYFSPFENKVVKKRDYHKIVKLDYTILNGKVRVKLYRLTRDRNYVYHVFDWEVDKTFKSSLSIDAWLFEAFEIVDKILEEIYKVSKDHRIDKTQSVYGHFQVQFYSQIDHYPASRTFGFYRPTKDGLSRIGHEFKTMMEDYMHKLETMSYHMLYINRLTLYIYAISTKNNTMFARFRSGVLNVK